MKTAIKLISRTYGRPIITIFTIVCKAYMYMLYWDSMMTHCLAFSKGNSCKRFKIYVFVTSNDNRK